MTPSVSARCSSKLYVSLSLLCMLDGYQSLLSEISDLCRSPHIFILRSVIELEVDVVVSSVLAVILSHDC